MIEMTATFKNVKAVQQSIKKNQVKADKAFETAVRVEGYNKMVRLKQEIRSGAPGGRRFAPPSMIARRMTRSSRVLRRLALGVRYDIRKKPFRFAFGWTGPKVSKSWKRLAEKHQEGFVIPVTEGLRTRFRRWGAGMSEGNRSRRYFFLKKTTTEIKTPARPILDPFWDKYREETWRNVRQNFRRKLRGERI